MERGGCLSSDAGLSYTLTDPTHDKCWIRWLMGAKETKDFKNNQNSGKVQNNVV